MTTIRRIAEDDIPNLFGIHRLAPIAWFWINETDLAVLTTHEEISSQFVYSIFVRKGTNFEHIFSGTVPDNPDRDGVFLRRLLPDEEFTSESFAKTLRDIHLNELVERRDDLRSRLAMVEFEIAEFLK